MVAPASVRQLATVLVVDDDPSKRVGVRAMLGPLPIALVEAESGRAALRAVATQQFAVILMDVRMPTLDGYATAKLIRERQDTEHTPIIFFTAFGLDESETHAAYREGAVDFIFTPVIGDVLRAKVMAFVELFEQSQQLQASLESITSLNEALLESELRAQAVVQNVADGIVTADEAGLIRSVNRSAEELFGYGGNELVDQPLHSIIAPSHREDFPTLRPDQPSADVETLGSRKDGSSFHMEVGLSQVQLGEGLVTIACLRDISGRRAQMAALESRTLHDDQTGLPNRALFEDRADQAIAYADRAAEPRAVLVVDMDGFGALNQSLGRATGDAVLKAAGERLLGAMRDSDTVARLGGDEFGILPAGATDVGAAAAIAWKVREALSAPLVAGGHSVDLTASIGMAFFPEHGRSTADLVRRAESALEAAKRSGKGIAVFATEPEDETARRLNLLDDLRQGIPRGELRVHYQPKVDLTEGPRTTGVEALVRWQHPTDGLLMPSDFIPEAELCELISPLTDWVLSEALRQQRAWLDAGVDLTMAVNISARSLARGSDLPDTVRRLIEIHGTDPARLVLEVTESSIIDADAPDTLNRLHAMGLSLSIDDFGTGHSSLAYLQRLPIDQVKIDRSFVMTLASVPSDGVIVQATIDLAHNLGLKVVAEGVEDAVALGMLHDYGCDQAQGFYFRHPCPADDLTSWLAESQFGAALTWAHH